jgi:CelD/BcsL family acetyltransferase involved in cellulose biosynthesis
LPPPPERFGIAVHERLAAFEALAPAWRALEARSIGRAPYTRYDWVRACWARHAGRRRLHIVTAEAEGRLVLVLPLCARRLPLGFHTLAWIDSETPFYSDAAVEDSALGRAAARAVGTWLAADRRLLKARFNYVPEGAAFELLRGEGRWYESARFSAGQLELGGMETPEALFKVLSKGFRRDFKACARVLESEGGHFARLTTMDAAQPVLDWIFATKGAQLAARGMLRAWFAAPQTKALFAAALRAGLADGSVVLFTIELAGRLAAAELAFCGGGTIYLSKGAYDPAFGRYSPGNYVRLRLIMDLMREGMTRVDFMIGDHAWKTRLRSGTHDVVHHRLAGRLLG